ncbi:uncharacterized protein LOC115335420 [Aquila chrysaetos chrysaetos]|uniref:uncharacterized protein LOC115335420 n=1 Tax=Aquila chrysaetos chrysaetos TaxID=223781 RepID=UPI001176ABA2|nr:uncharacterized protein LOC115335420 [Aquila chrysaetos chrysaetos]
MSHRPPGGLCPFQLRGSVTAWCWGPQPSPAGSPSQCVPTDRDCEEKDTAWCQCSWPCTLCGRDKACERCLWLDTRFTHPGDPWPQGHVHPHHHPGIGATPAWPWQGRRMGICFRLVSITPGLAFALGSVGGSGSGAMGAGALVLHPRFISVTTGCHRQPPASLRRGPQPCWCVLPAHAAASRGVRPPRPCLALPRVRWALGTVPGAGQWHPCRGASGGAEGYFTGYFTCWHQLFLPSAPTTFLPPEPLTLPPACPHFPTTGHRCGCATFPLCPPPFPPCPGTHCSASEWWYWESGCCAPGCLLKL